MDLQEFKARYKSLTLTSFDMLGLEGAQDLEFADAFINNPECRAWYIEQRLRELDFDYHRFCCLELGLWCLEDINTKRGFRAVHAAKPGSHRMIIFWEDFHSFGVRNSGGNYYVPLNYCPWCGKRLLAHLYMLSSHPDSKKYKTSPYYLYETDKNLIQRVK
jgi:hypothetical protein